MKTICVIVCPALLASVRLRLRAQLNQLSYIRQPIESVYQITHAPRPVRSEDGGGVGQKFSFNLRIAHWIVHSSAGVLDESSVPHAIDDSYRLCLVAAQ